MPFRGLFDRDFAYFITAADKGIWLGNLGNTYRNLEQVEQARQLYTDALRIFEEIKSPTAETIRKNLSSLQPKRPSLVNAIRRWVPSLLTKQ